MNDFGKEGIIKKVENHTIFQKTKCNAHQEINFCKIKAYQVYNKKNLGDCISMHAWRKKLKHKIRNNQPIEITGGDQKSIVRLARNESEKNVLKKLKKCGYDIQEMNKRYQGTKDKWTDPDFNYEDLTKFGKHAAWERPQQFLRQPDLFPEEISPNDVRQGCLSDCYFLSAVAALAEQQHRITNIFTTKKYNPNGYYVVKLYFNGIYQEVIVDDKFPVAPDSKDVSKKKTIFARPSGGKYIWTLILQKCWAKLLKGYSNANWGYSAEGFQTLTGAPTSVYMLKNYKKPQDPKCQKIFKKLLQVQEKRFCAMASVYNFEGAQGKKFQAEYGLPPGHVYSLLGAYEVTLKDNNVVKLLQIRNPWGTIQSKLNWRDEDPRWELVPAEQKERINFRLDKNNHDGVFYICWDDFIEKFEYFCSISEINDDSNYLYLQLEVEDRIPLYLQVETNGQPENLTIHFVQQMQEHFRQESKINYLCLNVIISRQGQCLYKTKTYHFQEAFNYFSKPCDNYFTLPRNLFSKGKYILRLYAFDQQRKFKGKVPIVVGLYSPALVGMRIRKDIDNSYFARQNCISYAQKQGNKIINPNDPHIWINRQILPNTNLGFLVFHHGRNSTTSSYAIYVNKDCDKNLHFLLEHENKQEVTILSKKGSYAIILFAYIVEKLLGMDKNLFPDDNVPFTLPHPRITSK